jgi:uncharacterized small protein (DUF1192 family)
MAAIDDEDRPKKKLSHEIGQDLTLLSVKELDERIALLRDEIARLEANKTGKRLAPCRRSILQEVRGCPKCPQRVTRAAAGRKIL